MEVWTVIQPVPGMLLHLAAGDAGLTRLAFQAGELENTGPRQDDSPLLQEAARQLQAYFDGRLKEFDLPLDLHGTAFQRRVWSRLRQIPYGDTISYAQLAGAVSSPKAFRAVGSANGRNPVPIIVPCHRVVQTGGGLGGFSCGIEYKRRLLELEHTRVPWRLE